MREYDIVQRFFAPLTEGYPGALGLKDDAALLSVPIEQQLVVSVNACEEGVHFCATDLPSLIARKALRRNLSDLAAMGAQPLAYTLTLGLSASCVKATWLEAFTAGLKADQSQFALSLIGVDMVLVPERLNIGITAFGYVKSTACLHRNTAMPGDRIYVSGTIGDAYLGLEILRGYLNVKHQPTAEQLISRYQMPLPRLTLGQSLTDIAHAATDISDGLYASLINISKGSGLVAFVRLENIPLSSAFQKVLHDYNEEERLALIKKALTFGDDYELLFTVPPHSSEEIEFLAQRHNIPLTHIGHLGSHNPLMVAHATFVDSDKFDNLNLNSSLVEADHVHIINSDGCSVNFDVSGNDHSSYSEAQ